MEKTTLYDLTGQESGIVVYTGDDGIKNAIICNWSSYVGLPKASPQGHQPIDLPTEKIRKVRGEEVPAKKILQGVNVIYDANNDASGILMRQDTAICYKIDENVSIYTFVDWN
jgi:hypothetical protein